MSRNCKMVVFKLVKMAFVFLMLFTLLDLSSGISYSDLKVLNATCTHRDTCQSSGKGPRLDDPYDWKSRNCFCDDLCADYGDCCLDAHAYAEEEQIHNRGNYECVPLTQFGTLYMRGKCTSEWKDKYIKDMCLHGSSAENDDPMAKMPVTSHDSFVTYSNYYCAICNNDSSAIDIWKSRLECPTLESHFRNVTAEYVATNLTYSKKHWGVYIKENEDEVFYPCNVYPSMPQTVVHMVRKCIFMIKHCPSNWTDETVRQLCQSYTAVRYDFSQAYRNVHCAVCHDLLPQKTRCYNQSLGRFYFRNDFNNQSFALLLDFSDRNGGNIVGSSSVCELGEVFDPFFKKCRNVVCGRSNQEYRFGRCIDLDVPDISTNTVSTSTVPNVLSTAASNVTNKLSPLLEGRNKDKISDIGNISSNSVEQFEETTVTPILNETVTEVSSTPSTSSQADNVTSNITKTPAQVQPCERFLLPTEEYTLNDNGTVMVEKYKRIYQINEYESTDGGILVCIIQNETEKFSRIMVWVTLAGLGLSCVCLLLHLIAFLVVPELRNLSGKNLASLCLVLLGAFSTFILSLFGEAGKRECFILAASMYYFFLSSFCWVNVMAFDVWRTLSLATTELRVSVGGQWFKFTLYSIYGWLLPASAVAAVMVIDIIQPAAIPSQYYPALGEYWCWFGHRKALLVFFAAPLMAIMVLNIILFILSARIIVDTMESTAKMTSCSPYQNQFKLYMRLALLMGLTWISGIVAGYLQLEPLWYIFILLNTLQGFFIFLAFTCTRKVWHAISCCGCWGRMGRRGSSWSARSPLSSKQGLQSTNSNVSNISQLSNTTNSPATHLPSNSLVSAS